MKRSKKIGIALAVIAAIVLATFVGSKLYFTDARFYYAAWGITLPKNTEKVYVTENMGFNDGIRYVVLQAKEDVSAWFEDCTKEKDLEFEQTVTNYLTTFLKVSNEQLPDWEQEYWWKIIEENDVHHLYVLYVPSEYKIILLSDE